MKEADHSYKGPTTSCEIPDGVARYLDGTDLLTKTQALRLSTVDPDGWPHAALLSAGSSSLTTPTRHARGRRSCRSRHRRRRQTGEETCLSRADSMPESRAVCVRRTPVCISGWVPSAGLWRTLVRRDRRVRVGAVSAPLGFSSRHAHCRRGRLGSRGRRSRGDFSRITGSRAEHTHSSPSRVAITRGAGFGNAARAVDRTSAGGDLLSRCRPTCARSSNGASANNPQSARGRLPTEVS